MKSPVNPCFPARPSRRFWGIVATLLGWAAGASAQVTIDALVTPLGGTLHYDITVHNGAAEDLALVSLLGAPLGDPLIGATLDAPNGFLASYDGGLGLVDFLGDSDVFAAGSTWGGFGFDSEGSPQDFFRTFEALGVLGNSFAGDVRVSVVPEAEATTAVAVLVAGAIGWTVRRRATRRAC